MRVALVYDRLNKIGGAERVLVALSELYPEADWYTSVWDVERAPFSRGWHVKSSFLSHIPWVRDHHEYYPFLMPFIFESFDFSSYDLVISVGSAECKGVITKPDTLHIHYCLTPTRYLYSHAKDYLSNPLYRLVAGPLREWDQVAAARPDVMIAISTQVKKRIKQYYHREAEVIYPPVDIKRFGTPKLKSKIWNLKSKYYLTVARLVSYKKIDVLVRAFASLPKHNLVIVGRGSEYQRLKKMATSNVHFVTDVTDDDLPRYYQHATAFLQANIEDFGIAMVEALASGTPVIAYGRGGASDIVTDGQTGILLSSNTPSAFAAAIDFFDQKGFDNEVCRRAALRFDKAKWSQIMKERINSYVNAQ